MKNKENRKTVCAIILAAGASTRMKTQKMLLPFNGKTIIENVVDKALKITDWVVVVLGSHKEQVAGKISDRNILTTVNENYSTGMLSSVICGFSALPAETKAALIFLGDQPQIPVQAAEMVIDEWEKSGKGIVIPVFNRKRGHPVLIETRFKPEIEKLDPEKGLRLLSQKFENEVYEVNTGIPEILRDIDTPEDYETEINNKHKT